MGCGPEFLHPDISRKSGGAHSFLLLGHEQFQLVGLDFLGPWLLRFDLNVAGGENALHRVVGTQKERAFVR